jgi:DNA-directed RNA polymerase subunit RPC12/RpoP
MFNDAVRQMIVDALVCPHCGERNRPGTKAQIELTEDGHVVCATCSAYGPLVDFERKKKES